MSTNKNTTFGGDYQTQSTVNSKSLFGAHSSTATPITQSSRQPTNAFGSAPVTVQQTLHQMTAKASSIVDAQVTDYKFDKLSMAMLCSTNDETNNMPAYNVQLTLLNGRSVNFQTKAVNPLEHEGKLPVSKTFYDDKGIMVSHWNENQSACQLQMYRHSTGDEITVVIESAQQNHSSIIDNVKINCTTIARDVFRTKNDSHPHVLTNLTRSVHTTLDTQILQS